MNESSSSAAVSAAEIPARAKQSSYPEPFASRVSGRQKRALGDYFGLTRFGVNLTRLEPGAMSALRHAHGVQDEFIYVVSGRPTLVTDIGSTRLSPGMCCGFPAGAGDAHHLINDTDQRVEYLEIGDRSPGDTVEYPDDDIQAVLNQNGRWQFFRKDGSPY